MTEIIRIRVWPNEEWSSIQVPNGAHLVWAEPVYIGYPPPGDFLYYYTYWSVPDWHFGERTVLVRTGSFPSDGSDGTPIRSLSGIPGAVPFIHEQTFLWIAMEGFIAGDYPPNSGQTSPAE
ncbi:hypothetical protein [Nocardia otitidiscaviarum]|uniref:hypothetical protein n=1 Tax=Nocardia otitidiscaviarum TaxID=1823 RepID=UPI002456DD01|nr:hypothetical protein [Nocardia otitidiscaviarum]